MSKMFNRARMTITSTGTGALTLGVAVTGYQTFSSAGVSNGDTVSYTIEDGVNWECGTGVFTLSGTTLSRTVTQSYNGSTYGTSPISVTTSAQVFVTALAADLQSGTAAGNLVALDGSAKLPAVDGSQLTNVPVTATNFTGTLPVSKGGTGLTSLTAGYIPYGNGTGAFNNSGNLTFDGAVINTNTGSSNSLIQFNTTSNTARYGSRPDISATLLASSAYPIWFNTETSQPIQFLTNGSERMRIASDGSVGIGYTTTSGIGANGLGVLGNVIIGASSNTYGGQLGLFSSGNVRFDFSTTSATSQQMLSFNQNGTAKWQIISDYPATGSGQLDFVKPGTGSYLTLNSAGNLGLGTTSPGARLHVSGGRSYFFSGDNYSIALAQTTAQGYYAYLGANSSGDFLFSNTSGNTILTLTNNSSQFGNLGLGVTPSAWNVGKVMQLSTGGSFVFGDGSQHITGVNAYYNSGWLYTGNGYASKYETSASQHRWFTAPNNTSGAGAAITFTQAMTLDASGNLGIGTASPTSLGSGYKALDIRGSNGGGFLVGVLGGSALTVYCDSVANFGSPTPMAFSTNGSERLRIDASGNVGIGTSSPGYKLHVAQASAADVSATFEAQTAGYAVNLLLAGNNAGGSRYNNIESKYGSTQQWYIGGAGNDATLVIKTGGSERARIDSSGIFLLNTQSALSTSNFQIYNSTNSTQYTQQFFNNYSGSGSTYFIEFLTRASSTNTQRGYILWNGTTLALTSSSDVSLKYNILPANSALSSILSLPIRQFDWKENDEHTDYGFVAQEVYEHAPEMVSQGDTWGVDYSRITPRLIKAFQELAAEVAELKAKVA